MKVICGRVSVCCAGEAAKLRSLTVESLHSGSGVHESSVAEAKGLQPPRQNYMTMKVVKGDQASIESATTEAD